MKAFALKTVLIATLIVGAILLMNKKPQETSHQTMNEHFTGLSMLNNKFMTKKSAPVREYNMEIPAYLVKKASNEYLSLYVDEKTLAIAIENKKDGYVWFSYDVYGDYSTYSKEKLENIQSGLTITTYNQFTPGTRTLFGKEVVITYDYQSISDGFKATIDFTEIQIKFDLIVKLDGKDVTIEIPRESIDEYHPELWQPGHDNISLSKIDVYPYLGATSGTPNGYIVIPDGQGAIVSLNVEPRTKIGYIQPVHGRDIGYKDNYELPRYNVQDVKPLSRITLPIYGIIHDVNNTGLLVISESGSNYANYNYIPKGLGTEYYQSYFNYDYRKTYRQFQSRSTADNILGFQKEPNEFDLKHRIVLLSDEDADYVGVAKKYREYLESHKGFVKSSSTSSDYSTRIEMIGNEVTNGIFNVKNVTTTPYDEAVDLLQTLKQDGFTNLDVTFKTYVISESAYRFDVFNHLGGKNDFNQLIQYTKDNDIDFSYFFDYVHNYTNTKDTAARMNTTALNTTNLTYMYQLKYINKARVIPGYVKEDLDVLNKYHINGVALGGLESILYTHNDKRIIVSSTQNMTSVIEALTLLNDNEKKIGVYNPDAYMIPYIDQYLDTPLTSSEMSFIDATIPLISLVVSGRVDMYSPYINFITNEDHSLLRLVEYGINPSYVMTSKNTYDLQYTNSSDIYISQYESLKARMEKYDAKLSEGLNAIYGQELIDHEFYRKGITISTFENGVKVVVNYTDHDFDYNGKIIKANGYGVI